MPNSFPPAYVPSVSPPPSISALIRAASIALSLGKPAASPLSSVSWPCDIAAGAEPSKADAPSSAAPDKPTGAAASAPPTTAAGAIDCGIIRAPDASAFVTTLCWSGCA